MGGQHIRVSCSQRINAKAVFKTLDQSFIDNQIKYTNKSIKWRTVKKSSHWKWAKRKLLKRTSSNREHSGDCNSPYQYSSQVQKICAPFSPSVSRLVMYNLAVTRPKYIYWMSESYEEKTSYITSSTFCEVWQVRASPLWHAGTCLCHTPNVILRDRIAQWSVNYVVVW